MNDFVPESLCISSAARAMSRRAAADATAGVCHVIVQPADGNPRPHQDAFFAEELARQGLQVESLHAADLDARNLPLALMQHFRFTSTAGQDRLTEFLKQYRQRNESGKRQVFHVRGVEHLDADAQRRWLQLAQVWGRTCQRQNDANEPVGALFAVLRLDHSLLSDLQTDVGLRLAWWWGVPSSLEMRLLCRDLENGQPRGPAAEWREHLAATLASGDDQFLMELRPTLTEPQAAVLRAARLYAERRQWTSERLRQRHRGLTGSSGRVTGGSSDLVSLEPPAHLRSAWNEGLVTYSPEFGCELHTAALALLNDKVSPAMLQNRFWRGQAALILPRLESVRYQACQRLTDKHNSGWPTRWRQPESSVERDEVQASPYACQWGYLKHLLTAVPQLKGERKLLAVAVAACELRNPLAHCRPVEFSDFERFIQATADWEC